MKKILSLALAGVMMVSALPVAYAAETQDYSLGTSVSIEGKNDGYTITVPATMEAGQTAQVTANGAWNSKQLLRVTTPESVAVSYDGQSIDVGVTFEGINQRGSDISAFNITKDITLEDVSTTFGTWTGVLEYNVEVVELISFSVTTDETKVYYAEPGMTYMDWINSEYNTEGFCNFNGMLGVPYYGESENTKGYYDAALGESRPVITVELRAPAAGEKVDEYGVTVYGIRIKDGYNITVRI